MPRRINLATIDGRDQRHSFSLPEHLSFHFVSNCGSALEIEVLPSLRRCLEFDLELPLLCNLQLGSHSLRYLPFLEGTSCEAK